MSEPIYEEKDGKIISCAVTVRKGQGEFSAKVYFTEYYKAGYNGKPSLWDTKPRTMIAKVAEMHALRKACPEELSQAYTEEEMVKEVSAPAQEITDEIRKEVENTKNEEELKAVWEKHKGLGKEFSQLVVSHKKFLKEVSTNENS